MCATYYVAVSEREMREIVDAVKNNYKDTPVKEGDIYPKDMAPVLWNDNGNIAARPMYWGLPLEGKKTVNFNARVENLKRIKLYKNAHPMVIPTNGFYEWQTQEKGKQKFIFNTGESGITYIAGIYVHYEGDSGYPYRYTMLTRQPDSAFSLYHNREPIVLKREECKAWLLEGSKNFLLRSPLNLGVRAV